MKTFDIEPTEAPYLLFIENTTAKDPYLRHVVISLTRVELEELNATTHSYLLKLREEEN